MERIQSLNRSVPMRVQSLKRAKYAHLDDWIIWAWANAVNSDYLDSTEKNTLVRSGPIPDDGGSDLGGDHPQPGRHPASMTGRTGSKDEDRLSYNESE